MLPNLNMAAISTIPNMQCRKADILMQYTINIYSYSIGGPWLFKIFFFIHRNGKFEQLESDMCVLTVGFISLKIRRLAKAHVTTSQGMISQLKTKTSRKRNILEII